MKPRRIGDGFLFITIFGMLLMFFYAVGSAAQSSVTDPVQVNREVHTTNVSENGTQIIEFDRPGQGGCFNKKVYDPSTEKQLEKPWNYTDQGISCEIKLWNYYNDDVQTHDISISYTTNQQDSIAVLSMAGFTAILNYLTSGFGILALLIVFILMLPRIYRALKIGGEG
jgi:hypothetical protein